MIHPAKTLDGLGLRARRRFSQNFLTAPHWADKLVGALGEGEGAQAVWEVGPGLGAITERLLEKLRLPLTAFEIDRDLAAHLRERFPSLLLIEGDVLRADWEAALPPGEAKVAFLSNLPYHISSEILFRLVEWRHRLSIAVLTFQKEFADRLVAPPGSADYGVLSVLIPAAFTITPIGVVPPDAFYPRPDVASKAVRLVPKEVADWEALRDVVRLAFQHRRKKMANTLSPLLSLAETEAILAEASLPPDCRPDRVPAVVFARLASRARESALADDACGC